MTYITEITGPTAWKSEDLYADKSWQYTLTSQDIDELSAALAYLKDCPIANYAFSKELFPLNLFGKKLSEISHYIENNRGVFLLRGVPVDSYSEEDIRLIYAGMGAYLGTPVRQSMAGELIYDVLDRGKSLTDKGSRGSATKDPLPFHTDRCDVVGLLCLRKSKQGGQSRVASIVSIHNEMLRRDPLLAKLLYEPYYHARTAWETGEENSYYPLPIFTKQQGFFAARYLRHFINVAQNIEGVAKMSEAQIAALNLFESIADDPEFCADMTFEPGDIQLLNNFVTLHSRAGYEDPEDPALKRHLLRLWLSVPNSRPLSSAFAPLFQQTAAGVIRGGVPEVCQ